MMEWLSSKRKTVSQTGTRPCPNGQCSKRYRHAKMDPMKIVDVLRIAQRGPLVYLDDSLEEKARLEEGGQNDSTSRVDPTFKKSANFEIN